MTFVPGKKLRIISKNTECNPGKSMKILRLSYLISRKENRDIIKIKDAQKASELVGGNDRKER